VSLRHEQRRALLKARDLLRDLLHPSTRPKTVKELRERARCALRHYPFLDERGEPMCRRMTLSRDSIVERDK
jgi:hypothetical protein